MAAKTNTDGGSMSHKQYLEITADDKNTLESFLNDVRKRADKGKVEFGVNINIKRIEEPAEIEAGFSDD